MGKRGTFTNAGKTPPPKPEDGLDWAKIMRCHRPEGASKPLPAKLQLDLADIDRRNRGLQTEYDDKGKQVRKPQPEGKKQGTRKQLDEEEIVRLYTQEHLTPQEIADKVGVKTGITITKRLREAGVYNPNKYKGGVHSRAHTPTRSPDSYKRKDVCSKGHDLTLPGATTERFKKSKKDGKLIKNGRQCNQCVAERPKQDNRTWADDPRNPKNGGSGTWTEERKEKKRMACAECGHGAMKHGVRCDVRDCKCRKTYGEVKAVWDAN